MLLVASAFRSLFILFRCSQVSHDQTTTEQAVLVAADGSGMKDAGQHKLKPVQYQGLEKDLIMRENEMQFAR